MSGQSERDAVWQALNLAFYALCDQLERAGAIDQDRLADEIARYDPGENDRLAANLAGIMATLRSRPFAPQPMSLDVIEGGKAD